MQAFNQPVNKKDVLPVLRSGFFMSITGGLIIGALHLLFMYYLDFSLSWLFLLILAHLIARRILQSYQHYHILFSIISVLFYIFAYYLMNLTMMMGIYFISDVFSMEIVRYLINPLLYFRFLNPLASGFFTTSNILDVVFFIVGIVYSYRFSK